MKQNKDQVIIIGAGIAGLSLAIQLAENKIACIVLEERHDFAGVTSGVRISSQGVRVLEKMKIRNVGMNTERTIMHYGSIIADFASGNPAGTSPAIVVTRLAVYEKLMEKVKLMGVEVITGFKLLNAIEHPDGVEVIAETGQKVTGQFLVGADGVGSTIRKILNPNQNSGKTYAGYLGVGLITPSDMKIEMSLYQHPGNHVGVASIGKVSSSDVNNNVFLWTHLYMAEQEAKAMTNEMVMKMLDAKSQGWSLELRKVFEMCKTDSKLIIAHGPVYNGKVPSSWFSKNIILIGDAAHPYGPGGQGISMALKDAEALCAMLLSGDMSEEKKEIFQKNRAEEAKKLGESAEARNKPEKQITSRWGIFFRGVVIKLYHFFNRGVLKSF
jgi:2-polyprenyl-6-methoxyphenol hydroxylase-like FAD-dependent oxidoreductase